MTKYIVSEGGSVEVDRVHYLEGDKFETDTDVSNLLASGSIYEDGGAVKKRSSKAVKSGRAVKTSAAEGAKLPDGETKEIK